MSVYVYVFMNIPIDVNRSFRIMVSPEYGLVNMASFSCICYALVLCSPVQLARFCVSRDLKKE